MTDYFVSQSGSGAADGTSPDNAFAIGAINWTGIGGGDTIYFLGELTQGMSLQANGDVGNPLTLRGDWAGQECYWNPGNNDNKCISAISRPNIDLINMRFGSVQGGAFWITYFRYCDNVSIRDCVIDNPLENSFYGFRFQNGVGLTCNNIEVLRCDIHNAQNGVRYDLYNTTPADKLDGFTVKDCNFLNTFFGNGHSIFMFSLATPEVHTNNAQPDNVLIEGNYATMSFGLCNVQWADGTPGTWSNFVQYNRTFNTGGRDRANNIQTGNNKGGVFRFNYCDTHHSTSGDGHHFIYDWYVDANDSNYYQTDSHVYGNHFINAYAPANTASGVKNFKGINNHTYANIIENCQEGINHSGGGSIAPNTGNKYYNNLILNCSNTGINSRNDGGGPSILNINNIIVGCGTGISTQTGVTAQVENNNCVYDCPTPASGLTLDASTLQVDPVLVGFKLETGVSPCIGAGDNSLLPYNDFDDVAFTDPPNMGAYETTASVATVDAGGPYSGEVNSAIALDATVTGGSDPSPSVLWTIVSGGAGVFADDTAIDTSFTPAEANTTYVLRLTVTPNDSSPVSDDATLVSQAAPPSVVEEVLLRTESNEWYSLTSGGDSYWEPGTNPDDIVNTNIGNVGIGTDPSPDYLLDVNGVIRSKNTRIIDDTAAAGQQEWLHSATGAGQYRITQIGSVGSYNAVRIGSLPTGGIDYIRFATGGEGALSEVMRLAVDGTVTGLFKGAGITQSSSKFEVVAALPGTPDPNTIYFVTE